MIFNYGKCNGCGDSRFSDRSCCGGQLTPARTYKCSLENGVLTIRKPGDPVLWKMRCANENLARRTIPSAVQSLERGKPPFDAVHRGVAARDRVMAKGQEITTQISVSLSALLGEDHGTGQSKT